jgi:hypothetical protein
MDTRLAKDILHVIRTEKQRRISLLDDMDSDLSYDRWTFTDAPFIAELCLMLLVALSHEVERKLIGLAARAADGGREIDRHTYRKRVAELQHRNGLDWTEILSRLKLESCAGHLGGNNRK